MHCLLKYPWPGNVRELENLIERLTILTNNDVVTVADLPEKLHQLTFEGLEQTAEMPKATDRAALMTIPAAQRYPGMEIGNSGIDLNQMVSNLERSLIMQALEKTKGVRSKAAQLLSLNRTTLLEKMKKMGIDVQKT
jgi:sigma-54 specific flagellar transcriptional regulator A